MEVKLAVQSRTASSYVKSNLEDMANKCKGLN